MLTRQEIAVLARDVIVGFGYGFAIWGTLLIFNSESIVSVGAGSSVGLLVFAAMRKNI